MGVKHAMDSIMTEGFLKSLFHSKANPLILGILYKDNYINHEVSLYEFNVTVEYGKRLNVTIVFEKFQSCFLKTSKVNV